MTEEEGGLVFEQFSLWKAVAKSESSNATDCGGLGDAFVRKKSIVSFFQ